MFASQGADEDLDLRNSAFYGDYLHASSGGANGVTPVSYTHLTLPTSDLV